MKSESVADPPGRTTPQIHLLKVRLPAMKALQNTAMKFSNHKCMLEQKNMKKEEKDGAAGAAAQPPAAVAAAATEEAPERRMATSRSAKSWTRSDNKALVNVWSDQLKKSKQNEVSIRAITAILNKNSKAYSLRTVNKQVFQARCRLIQLIEIYDSYDKEQQLNPSALTVAQYMSESAMEMDNIRDCKIVD